MGDRQIADMNLSIGQPNFTWYAGKGWLIQAGKSGGADPNILVNTVNRGTANVPINLDELTAFLKKGLGIDQEENEVDLESTEVSYTITVYGTWTISYVPYDPQPRNFSVVLESKDHSVKDTYPLSNIEAKRLLTWISTGYWSQGSSVQEQFCSISQQTLSATWWYFYYDASVQTPGICFLVNNSSNPVYCSFEKKAIESLVGFIQNRGLPKEEKKPDLEVESELTNISSDENLIKFSISSDNGSWAIGYPLIGPPSTSLTVVLTDKSGQQSFIALDSPYHQKMLCDWLDKVPS